ncbi:MSC_0620 family F1-like ATPase-associated subunit [Mycoplasmopsis alligatoris]|uniref:Uncharacterized protein n=1 Tax=Mycoplasmopsis alligatoris A21JP2 TaxID=747682 RepID=D4XVL9_9BACT|nr:hypothetical protein [Mycoplasmopsis alligatoris]EFF41671.1 hypothetical protein MALL_0560 [Mycoplasmopsis alligatoris A21JP2]
MKKKNKILLLGTFSALSITSASVVAASLNSKETKTVTNSFIESATFLHSEANGANDNGATPAPASPATPAPANGATTVPDPNAPKPKPEPVLAVDFKDFEGEMNRVLKEEMKKILDAAKVMIETRISELSKDGVYPTEEKFALTLYAKAVKDYYDTVFSKLTSYDELYKAGFRMVFPKMYAKSEKYILGTVKYNGQEFDPIGMGQADPYDYKFLEKDTPEFKDKDGKPIKNEVKTDEKAKFEVNSTSKAEYVKLVTNYFQSFGKQLEGIFFEKTDSPVYGKDFKISFDKIDKSIGLYNIKPENYNDWNAYISEKVKVRFTEFDLRENEAYHQEQQQQNQPVIPPQPVDFLPDTTEKAKPVNPNIENIPPLEPLLNPELTSSDFNGGYEGVIGSWNSDPNLVATKSKKWFWFQNPINIRYEYTVTNLAISEGKHIATVEISDKANLNSKRFYNIIVNFKKYTQSQAKARYTMYETFRGIFKSIYDAFKLDEKIDYNTVPDQHLRLDLFNAVFLAIKSFELKEFTDAYNKLAATVGNADRYRAAVADPTRQKDELDKYNNYLKENTTALISRFLEARGIRTGKEIATDNPRTFWEFLSKSLEFAINGEPFKLDSGEYRTLKLRQHLEDPIWKPKFKKFFEEVNATDIDLSKTFLALQKDALNLRKMSTEFFVSLEDRIAKIKTVYDGFYNHAAIFKLIGEKEKNDSNNKPAEGDKPEAPAANNKPAENTNPAPTTTNNEANNVVSNDKEADKEKENAANPNNKPSDDKKKESEFDTKLKSVLTELRTRQANLSKNDNSSNAFYAVFALITAIFGSILAFAVLFTSKVRKIKISKSIIAVASVVSIITLVAFISILLLMIGVI